jgi:N-acetylneuraminate synthase
MQIGSAAIGKGRCYIIAEVGVNHNGSEEIAHKLVDAAAEAGCSAVKLQKRTPEIVVPREQWQTVRATPFGDMHTIEYRRRMELSAETYAALKTHAEQRGMHLLASAWDAPSVEFVDALGVPAHKVPSAKNDDVELLRTFAKCAHDRGVPVLLSSGFMTVPALQTSIHELACAGAPNVCVLQCTANYPTSDDELDLPALRQLRTLTGFVGYSGHESGLLPTLLAATQYGAMVVERHITLDRGMPGSDHGASIEPKGLALLVRDIRRAESLARGSKHKRVHDSEKLHAKRLGRTQ